MRNRAGLEKHGYGAALAACAVIKLSDEIPLMRREAAALITDGQYSTGIELRERIFFAASYETETSPAKSDSDGHFPMMSETVCMSLMRT